MNILNFEVKEIFVANVFELKNENIYK